MYTKISVAVMVCCGVLLVSPCDSSSADNPTKQFYEDMQTRPILIYQCYRNGTSIDPANSTDLTLLFDGTNPNTTQAYGVLWWATIGKENSYAKKFFSTHYDEARGVAVLSTDTITEDFTVLEKFEGKGLFFKIESTSHGDRNIYKIYDVDFRCKNADKILAAACPDGCNMVSTRQHVHG